jgi:hypothetical protein
LLLYQYFFSSQPKKWSLSSDWKGTEEGWGGHGGYLPKAGEDVQIPNNWWMIYDTSMEGLGNVRI